MNASNRAQHKHEPAMKITEVKQPQDQSNSKMGDHTFCLFSVAEILGIFCQIILISLNFGKTPMSALVSPYQQLNHLCRNRHKDVDCPAVIPVYSPLI